MLAVLSAYSRFQEQVSGFSLSVSMCHVIFGRIPLCGTVLLRHDVEVRDRQSLFSLSLSLSLFESLYVCINSLHLPLKKHISEFILLVY